MRISMRFIYRTCLEPRDHLVLALDGLPDGVVAEPELVHAEGIPLGVGVGGYQLKAKAGPEAVMSFIYIYAPFSTTRPFHNSANHVYTE